MGLGELFLLAVGLAMDAFAVAVCKGLSIQKLKLRHALLVGLWFGVFQALMPAVGYLLGSVFAGLVQAVDHWVAFILLGIIGGNMIREGVKGDAEDCDPSLAFGTMLIGLPENEAEAANAIAYIKGQPYVTMEEVRDYHG